MSVVAWKTPLHRLGAKGGILRQEASRLGREVHQDRARLRERERLAVGAVAVDDRGRIVPAGLMAQIVGLALLAREQVELVHACTAGRTRPA